MKAKFNHRYTEGNRRCRVCQYYRQRRCDLLDMETRGTYTCDLWMPLYKPLDVCPEGDVLNDTQHNGE